MALWCTVHAINRQRLSPFLQPPLFFLVILSFLSRRVERCSRAERVSPSRSGKSRFSRVRVRSNRSKTEVLEGKQKREKKRREKRQRGEEKKYENGTAASRDRVKRLHRLFSSVSCVSLRQKFRRFFRRAHSSLYLSTSKYSRINAPILADCHTHTPNYIYNGTTKGFEKRIKKVKKQVLKKKRKKSEK